MTKRETPVFELYKTMMHNTEDEVRALGGKNTKKVTRKQMLQDTAKYEPHFMESLNFILMAEEYYWARTSKRVLLPESSEIFERLLNAEYTMGSAEGFALPFSSFSVAMPAGFKHQDIILPPFLVTYSAYEESDFRVVHPFCDYLKVHRPDVKTEECTPGSYGLSISYREPGTSAYVRSLITDDDLPHILESKTPEECHERIGNYDHLQRLIHMSPTDRKIQFWLLKLVSAIGIYNIATAGHHIQEGFPGKRLPALIDKDPSQMIFMSYLSTADKEEIKPALKGPAVAITSESLESSWHFNQRDLTAHNDEDGEDNPFGLYFASGGQ